MSRLRGRRSFLDIRRNGARARMGPISVLFAPRADHPAEVAYAISRRVGNAVVRNRIRRRLRGALNEFSLSGVLTLRGGLYVITAAPGAVGLSYQVLQADLRGALRKVFALTEPAGAVR